MKTEYLPLVVALVAASASLVGVAISQFSATSLEKAKWEQARKDAHRENLNKAVLAYAQELGNGVQRAELFMWYAKYDPKSITRESFVNYEKESNAGLGRLAALRLTVTSLDGAVAKGLEKPLNAFYQADACITSAGINFRQTGKFPESRVVPCEGQTKNATKLMFQQFESVLSGQSTVPSER